eukprot:6080883-Prymnesium_polylepis.2
MSSQPAGMSPLDRAARDMAAAGVANAFSSALLNPSDVTKIRLQTPGGGALYSGGLSHCVQQIVQHEGASALWLTGLPASMLREAFYSTTRMGLYPYVKQALGTRDDNLGGKILAGAVTGSIGSILSNPIDVVKVGIMAEAGAICSDRGVYTSGLRAGEVPRWSNTLTGLREVIGSGPLRGAAPSVFRGALMAASQMASYDHSKHLLRDIAKWEEGTTLHVTCSLISGFTAAFVTAPADMIKTRMMGDRAGTYKSSVECVLQTCRGEGVFSLWRGMFASYLRLGPHFLLTFPLYERIRFTFGLGNL